MKKVAVTGGLSCGKSLVCRYFKECGAYVVSADEIVHQLLSPDTDLGQKVITLLGKDIVVNGQMDRSKIAEKVFKDKTLLASLERLIHPAVQEETERHFRYAQETQASPFLVVEIPLLFETGREGYFDATVAVLADPALCRQRFKQASDYDEKDYVNRMARQMTPEEKAERADLTILNNGTKEELKQTVKKIFQHLLETTTYQ